MKSSIQESLIKIRTKGQCQEVFRQMINPLIEVMPKSQALKIRWKVHVFQRYVEVFAQTQALQGPW